ncbi:MAG: hypothetical protein ACFFCP_16285, partial [Promethearchaeota archaeon]
QVASFAMVLRTIYMVKRKETLGRELTWAFDSPQLLIVPRAGEAANAFYHRDGRCLQFFYLPDAVNGKPMYTCLSRDIVAHETGHAIIDSIAPDLLDACTPQSLAIHEALADLTACLMAFESHTLREMLLKELGGSIINSSLFSSIAEEFGDLLGHRYGLRNLNNEKNLDPNDKKNGVSSTEPHELSEVLSGALYKVLLCIYKDLIKKYEEEKRERLRIDIAAQWDVVGTIPKKEKLSDYGYALAKTIERFQRMIFRGLDYLPPGEVTFADYARAMIAVDRVAYAKDDKMRNWIRNEFLERKIISDLRALDIRKRFDHSILADVNIENLCSSDWVAYWFANKYGHELFIPPGVVFEVRPRLLLKKKYDERDKVPELLFKVSWQHEEELDLGSKYPKYLRYPVGTTLAIDWERKEIVALLTNAPPTGKPFKRGELRRRKIRQDEFKHQKKKREEFLRSLVKRDLLKRGSNAIDHNGKPLLSVIQADVSGGRLRVRGAGKLFHIIDEERKES